MADNRSKPLKYKMKADPAQIEALQQRYRSYNPADASQRAELEASRRVQRQADLRSQSERVKRNIGDGVQIRAASIKSQEKIFGESVKNRSARVLSSAKAAAAAEAPGEEIDDHLLTVEQLTKRYGTALNGEDPASSEGLSSNQAQELLAKLGANSLSPPKEKSKVLQFLELMLDPFIVMLMVAGVLSLFTQIFSSGDLTPTYLGVVLILVLLGNVTVDFIQLQKSARVLASFGKLSVPRATVVRDGVASAINASELVLGDLVKVTSGDKLPADLRLVFCTAMKVDNSSLTGEAEPQTRRAFADHRQVLEAENLAFFGTTVVNGWGLGVIVRTGDATVMGKIAKLAGEPLHKSSPLTQEIKMFVTLMAITALVTAVVIFIAGMGINGDFVTNLLNFVGVFVAFTPQGLPATVTMLLTAAAQSLASRNVLVKDLRAVDTLGTITMLASDKTGTLTQNRMTVVRVWQNLKTLLTLEAAKATSASTANGDVFETKAENELVRCISLCNSADFEKSAENMAKPVKEREVMGDATETGLLRMVADVLDVEALRKELSSALDMPFNSKDKYALSIRRAPHANGNFTLYLKGAPERVLRRCTTAMVDDQMVDITTEYQAKWFQDEFTRAYEGMASEGHRVIACAMMRLPGEVFGPDFSFDAEVVNYPMEGLTFLGLTGLQDPPKVGVKEAIASCRLAQIQVMMVTGDHPLTAAAIAKQVGIILGRTRDDVAKQLGCEEREVPVEDYDAVVVHGEQMTTMDNEEWAKVLSKREVVFARTSPEQKLEIVLRCQAWGHVVGVTGDGVNDSPALKRSDMGIAMAITGSDVSREAAAIVLLDDNFASVVSGIEEGRKIFVNLKKAIQFTLAHIMPELMPFIFYIIIGLPLPLSSFLILFIDLGTELAPALSFAFEPAEDNIMQLPPRRFVAKKDVVVSAEEVPAIEDVGIQVEHVDISLPGAAESRRELSHKIGHDAKHSKRCGPRITELCQGLKPNHPKDEVLVDRKLIYWSYLQNGVFETAWGMIAYFAIFNYKGIPASELVRMTTNYFPAQNDGTYYSPDGKKSWSPNEQKHLLAEVQSAYFFTVVIMQFFVAHMLKVLNQYPCSPASFVNKTTYYGMVFSTALAFFVTCTPGITKVLGSSPFPFWSLGISVAGGFSHLIFETLRRCVIFHRAAKRREAEVAGQPPVAVAVVGDAAV